jgi:hypothetical protein
MTIALALAIALIQFGLVAVSSSFAQVTSHTVINEVEMDLPGPDFGKQWFELYNPTTSSVDISGWQLKTASGAFVKLQANTTVPAGGYLLVTLPRITLMRSGDSMTIRDAKGDPIDSTPMLRDVADNNLTWQRFPNGLDTGAITDWRFAIATKGQSNGKFGAAISLASSAISTTYGEPIILSGQVNLTGTVEVGLMIRSNSFATNVTVQTLDDGTFVYNWRPASAGGYAVTAFWNGNALHNSATSSPMQILVDRITTEISMHPISANISEGASETFMGTIFPAVSEAPVAINIRAPNGSLQLLSSSTVDNGSFRFVLRPSAVGTWNLTASWPGDANHYGDDTATSTLTVIPVVRYTGLPILILELITIPVTLAAGVYIYKYAGPLRAPLGQILKRRAPPHLRPLRVLNGAICPICFRPMMYEPKGADWHCEHCGVYYET